MNKTTRIAYLEVVYSDESFGFHKFIRRILSQPEFQVVRLLNQAASVEEVIATKPHLIIVDLRRPESPNWELHRKIIMSDELNHLPILLITEKGYDSTPLGFEYTKMEDYACYPLFDEAAFLLIMQNLLRRIESNT